jgi:hypothetical protein
MGKKEKNRVKFLAVLILLLNVWHLMSLTQINFFQSFYPSSLWLSFYGIALFLVCMRIACAWGILKFKELARQVFVYIVLVSSLMTCVSFFVQQKNFIRAYMTDYDAWVRDKVEVDFERRKENLTEEQKQAIDLETEQAVAYADRLCITVVNGFLIFVRLVYLVWYVFLIIYLRKPEVKADFS